MAIPQKPKLLYQVVIERRKFIRRFVWSLLGAVTAVGAGVALTEAANRSLVDPNIVQVGTIVSLVVAALFGLRALVNLWRGLRQRTETLRIFDKGIILQTPRGEQKMGWSQVLAFREGGGGFYLGKRPLVQWGAHRLKLQTGKIFRVSSKYGDLRQLGAILRRYAAHVTGIQMGQMLRAEKPVKLNRSLTVWPGGVEVG
ncbi:MAG: YcxB family protein, partial [Anaerolineae bacterium]|nr:YcxB family protein [Anaerolineae bacterium]